MDKFVCLVLLSAFINGITTEKLGAVREAREEYGDGFVSSTISSSVSDDGLSTPAPENILRATSVSGAQNPIFSGVNAANRQPANYLSRGYAGYKSSSYASSGEDDGSYKPHLYGGGQYLHDNSGNYLHQDVKYVHDGRPYVHELNPYVHSGQYVHDGKPYVHEGQYIHSEGQYTDSGKLNKNLGYTGNKYAQNQYGAYYGAGGYSHSDYKYPGYYGAGNYFNAYNNSAYQLKTSGQNAALLSGIHYPYQTSYYSGYNQYNSGLYPGSSAVTHSTQSSTNPSVFSDNASAGLSVQQGSSDAVDNRVKSSGATSSSYYSGKTGSSGLFSGGLKSTGLSSGQYQTGAHLQTYPGYVNTYQTGYYNPLSYNKGYVAPTYNAYAAVAPTSSASSSLKSSSGSTLSGSTTGTQSSAGSVSSAGSLKSGYSGALNTVSHTQQYLNPGYTNYYSGAYNYGTYNPYTLSQPAAVAPTSSASLLKSSSGSTLSGSTIKGLAGSVSSAGSLKSGYNGALNTVSHTQQYLNPGYTNYYSGAYNYGTYNPYTLGGNGAYRQSSQYDTTKYYGGSYPGYYPSEVQTSALKSSSVSSNSQTSLKKSSLAPQAQSAFGSYKTSSYNAYNYPSAGSFGQNALHTATGNPVSPAVVLSSSSLSTAAPSLAAVAGSSDTSDVSSVANRVQSSGIYNAYKYPSVQTAVYQNAGSFGQNTQHSVTGNPVISSSSLAAGVPSLAVVAGSPYTSSDASSVTNKIQNSGIYSSGLQTSGNAQTGGSGSYDFSSFGKKIVSSVTPAHLTTTNTVSSSKNYQAQGYPSAYFHGYYQQPQYGLTNDAKYGQGYYQNNYHHTCGADHQHPGYYEVNHFATKGNANLPGYNVLSSYGYYGNSLPVFGSQPQPVTNDVLLNQENLVGFSSTVAPSTLIEVTPQES